MPCERELKHLLNLVNAVTAPHRHGQSVSKRRLDDLANAQVEYEEAMSACDESPWRSMESAPKDGTPISVLNEYNNPWYHVWWYVPTNPRARKGPHWRSYLGEVPFDPVKWAPLPAAPEEKP